MEEIGNTNQNNNFQIQFEDFTFGGLEDINEDYVDSDADSEDFSYQLTNIDALPNYATDIILKPEEQKIIDKCEDTELRKLLMLNRSKQMMLYQLFWKVKEQLRIVVSDICIQNEKLESHKSRIKRNRTLLGHLASPYFKTTRHFTVPLNEETIQRQKNKELTIYNINPSPRWTLNDRNNLVKVVCMVYNNARQKEMIKKIVELQQALKEESQATENAVKLTDEIASCQNTLKYLVEVGSEDVPPLKTNNYIDWERISEVYLAGKHTPEECRSFWHLYLHPHINKSIWTKAENNRLIQITEDHNYQDWDAIAEALDTGRSGFSTCLHFHGNIYDKFTRRKFTQQEDSLLCEVIENVRIGSYIPWKTVEQYFPNRSRMQLLGRYRYYLNDKAKMFGHFTEAEDILLLILINRFGKKYAEVAQYMPHRSYMQIKSRYCASMSGKFKKGTFTLDEDLKILEAGKKSDNGERKIWSELSKKMERGRGHLRQRYVTLKNYLAKYPGDIVNAPRKKFLHDHETHHCNYEYLLQVAEKFRNSKEVPTLEDVEALLRKMSNIKKNDEDYVVITDFDKIDTVEVEIINYFINENKKRKEESIAWNKMDEATESIFEILIKLKAHLNIPSSTSIVQAYQGDSFLDNNDIEILKLLRSLYESNSLRVDCNSINYLIPANLNTLTGLKNLLIQKSFTKRQENVYRNIQYIQTLENIMLHTFNERFYSIFLWAALFSFQDPSRQLLHNEYGSKTFINLEKGRQKFISMQLAINDCLPVEPSNAAKSNTKFRNATVEKRSFLLNNSHNTEKKSDIEVVYIPSTSKDVITFLSEDTPFNEISEDNTSNNEKRIKSLKRSGSNLEDVINKKQQKVQGKSDHKTTINILNNIELKKCKIEDNDKKLNTTTKNNKIYQIPITNAEKLKNKNKSIDINQTVPFKITIPKNVKNLTKVDKKVIENLVKNGKKLVMYNLKNIQLGKEVQTVIKPVADVKNFLKTSEPTQISNINIKKLKNELNKNIKKGVVKPLTEQILEIKKKESYNTMPVKKNEENVLNQVQSTTKTFKEPSNSELNLSNFNLNKSTEISKIPSLGSTLYENISLTKNQDEMDVDKLNAFLDSIKNEEY